MAAKSNQFSALSVKNVENRLVEEEMAFEKAIAEAVQAAVNTEATKKFETRSNTKSAKAKNNGYARGGDNGGTRYASDNGYSTSAGESHDCCRHNCSGHCFQANHVGTAT